MSENLKLWDSVCETDPKMTKAFNNGTYSGTAIDPQYQAKLATEIFGPFGIGWGLRNEKFNVIDVDENTKLMFYHAEMWFKYDGQEGHTPVTSGIKLSYMSKAGRLIVDADATKKLQTNAISKGLSREGFNADIFLGMFEDNQYVQVAKDLAEIGELNSTIEDHECGIISKLLRDLEGDEAAFLDQFGVESVTEIKRGEYAKAINMLKAKAKQRAAK